MRIVRLTSQFKKSLKKFSKSGIFDKPRLKLAIDSLASGKKLDTSFSDHALGGKFLGCRECHIKSDILLVYRIESNNLVLVLVNLGSHSDLFE